MSSTSDQTYDLIGIGFGPANVAIAGALLETWEADKSSPVKNVLFLERHKQFRWHPGMLLPDARMQISFMKDLATLRNPRSPITFLSYLHSQDRLVNFINRGSTIPTRKEYADYLGWAAQYVEDHGVNVRYGSEVVSLDDAGNGIILVRIRDVTTSKETVYRTKDLVISPGGSPSIPSALQTLFTHSESVIHSSTYTSSIPAVLDAISARPHPLRIAVIGSGQSGAEVTLDLRERLRSVAGGNHQIELILRKGSLKPSDDSPFANEIFDPEATEAWFSMPSTSNRAKALREYRSTNYGVVNPRTIDAMYEIIYDQKLDESVRRRENRSAREEYLPPQITFRTYSDVLSAETPSSSSTLDNILNGTGSMDTITAKPEEPFTLLLRNLITEKITSEKYDAIVLATGYHRHAWIDYLKLGGLGKHFGLSPQTNSSMCLLRPQASLHDSEISSVDDDPVSDGSSTPISENSVSTAPTSPSSSVLQLSPAATTTLSISRQYRLLPVEEGLKSRIYLQGVEEATHGLSDTLLSVLGVRSGEVVKDLCDVRRV